MRRIDWQVHGVTSDGAEIVRYARSGKWYLEDYTTRRQVPLSEAVRLALASGATVHLGCPGGRRFDAAIRKAQAINRGASTKESE